MILDSDGSHDSKSQGPADIDVDQIIDEVDFDTDSEKEEQKSCQNTNTFFSLNMDKCIQRPPQKVFNYDDLAREGAQFAPVVEEKKQDPNNEYKNDKQFLNEMQDLFDQ